MPGEDFDREKYQLVFYRQKEGTPHFLKCNRHGELMADLMKKYWNRLRRFFRVVGKLNASMRIGREKRLSKEQRLKQAEEMKNNLLAKAKSLVDKKKQDIEEDIKKKEKLWVEILEAVEAKATEHEAHNCHEE